MGLFDAVGNGIKGLFGEGFGDRAAIAGAMIDGDYAGAARIRQSQANAKAQQQGMQHAFAALKAMGMPDDQAAALASDPSVSANFIADHNKGQQYSASGGSHFDPITNKWDMAPSRHEFQGTVFDVGGGAPGQQAQVTPQHEGTQWITPQPGTTAFGVNSFSGLPMGGGEAPAPPASPSPGGGNDLRAAAIEAIKRGADPAKVLQRMQQMMQGGQAGQPSPGGFPL